ncbi:hypothetical protein G6F26_007930 [Rhizopus arrhizus]|nr:hypothetical protein G6F21_006260 [Rhizopus arrhizus]KAG0794119.1 hypothetical protein G6F22_005432 [Rhizopus arrhizus]KAG0806619.1 hypothetical protein G6F20_010991 [Rhizopus arrhizus]KAG0868864.1 hypothetical protein G6F16_007722 [Rhizopus arrhizus]KAG0872625.1 hypothetical protein G6F15_011072 [Rhizopus arrhizus]
MVSRQRCQARIWIRSAEKNSVAFEMPKAVLPTTFLKALAAQFSTAISVVPVKQEDHHGVIVAFDTVEAQTKACSIDVQVGSLTIIGTQTLSSDNSIYRISLHCLPILRPEELTPLVRQMLEPYGKVLHIGLLPDPATNLFFGKRFALRDTSTTEGPAFRELLHEMHLDNHRLVFASWRSMEAHCFYCHKPGHIKATCPILESQQRNNRVGFKRPRMDPITHREANTTKARHSNEMQQDKPATSTIDNIIPPQDQVENHTSQAKPQDLHHMDNRIEASVSRYEVPKTHSINLTHTMSIHENNYNIMKQPNDLTIKDLDNSEDTESDSDYQLSAGDQSEITESDTEEHGSEDEMDLDEEVRILQEEARAAKIVQAPPLINYKNGRLLAAQVSHISGLYDPINIFVIYVPAQHRERIEFLRSFPTTMPFDQLLTSRSIFLGDFNHNIHTRSSSPSLAQWFQWIHLNWYDPINADLEHNNTPTFRNISTIDFLLITADLIDMVDNQDIKYVARCDHSAISTYLTLRCTRTGPGIWHCNPYLAQDPHFRAELTAFCTNAEHFLSNLDTPLLWDLLKCRLKSFIQAFSNKSAAQRRRNRNKLQRTRKWLLRQPTDDETNAQIASV